MSELIADTAFDDVIPWAPEPPAEDGPIECTPEIRGAENVSATTESAAVDGDLWESTPELAHICRFARARRVSSWALLGAVLTRLCATIPPTVVLPPLIGSHGSLNLFVGIVGTSGMGKGAAERAARDAFPLSDVFTSSIGSGEGLLHLFVHYEKDEDRVVVHQDRVLLSVPEVDALTALGGRQGATLLPTLRSAFTGEQLSPAYANREKALRLDDHAYRLSLIMGIQPGRAGALLGDSDGGTPQRFLWLPATDPGAPDIRPEEPDPVQLHAQLWPVDRVELSVPDVARHRILTERAEVLRGNRPSSHLLFVRLKVAALLAILAGRRAGTRHDWAIAGKIIRKSEQTRQEVERYLKAAALASSRDRGQLDGERAAARDDTAALRRVCQWTIRRLQQDGPATAGALRKAADSSVRDLIDPALERLREVGTITESAGSFAIPVRQS